MDSEYKRLGSLRASCARVMRLYDAVGHRLRLASDEVPITAAAEDLSSDWDLDLFFDACQSQANADRWSRISVV